MRVNYYFNFIFFSFFILSALAVNTPIDVPVAQEKELEEYINVPQIKKEFSTDQDHPEKQFAKESCQTWVFDQLQKLETQKVHSALCMYRADVVLRKHIYTARIILKNW